MIGTGALVAVGGYGRGELHPCSDIDILLLVSRPPNDAERSQVERLITFLWDIGLEVGHSVRTVAECVQESAADVSVMTTLLEARLVHGDAALLAEMNTALAAPGIWPEKEFFEAKVKEQTARHLKANDTAYNLEPNVKTGPGRPSRHPDHQLDRQASLRCRVARWPRAPGVHHRERTSAPKTGAILLVEGALRAAHRHGPARRPAAV